MIETQSNFLVLLVVFLLEAKLLMYLERSNDEHFLRISHDSGYNNFNNINMEVNDKIKINFLLQKGDIPFFISI